MSMQSLIMGGKLLLMTLIMVDDMLSGRARVALLLGKEAAAGVLSGASLLLTWALLLPLPADNAV